MNQADDRMRDGTDRPPRQDLSTSQEPAANAPGCWSAAGKVLFVLIMVFTLFLFFGTAGHVREEDVLSLGLEAPEVATIVIFVSVIVFGGFYAALNDLDRGLRLGAAIVAAVAVSWDCLLLCCAIGAAAAGMGD